MFTNLYYSIPYEYRPDNIWYNFKCWAFHRYSTVKSKHLHHAYVDSVELLPYTMFQILDDFVEKEHDGNIDISFYNQNDENEKHWHDKNKKIMELYNWWNYVWIPWKEIDVYTTMFDKYEVKRDFRKEGNHYVLDNKFQSEEDEFWYNFDIIDYLFFEEYMEEKLNQKMQELCMVRRYLWT